MRMRWKFWEEGIKSSSSGKSIIGDCEGGARKLLLQGKEEQEYDWEGGLSSSSSQRSAERGIVEAKRYESENIKRSLSAERCDALLNCDFASGLFDYQIDSYLVAREWRLEHILNDPSSYMHAHNMGPPRSDEEGVMIYPRVLDRSRWVCERDYAVFRDGVPKRVKKGVIEMFEDMIYYHYNKVLRPELIKPEYEEWEKTTTSKEWEVLKRQHGRWGRSKWYKVRDCSVQVRVAGGGGRSRNVGGRIPKLHNGNEA